MQINKHRCLNSGNQEERERLNFTRWRREVNWRVKTLYVLLLHDLRFGYLHLIFSDTKREDCGDGVSILRWRLSHNNGAVKHQRSTPVIFIAKNYVLESCSSATAERIVWHTPLYISQIDRSREMVCPSWLQCLQQRSVTTVAEQMFRSVSKDITLVRNRSFFHMLIREIQVMLRMPQGIFYNQWKIVTECFCLHLQDRRANFCEGVCSKLLRNSSAFLPIYRGAGQSLARPRRK